MTPNILLVLFVLALAGVTLADGWFTVHDYSNGNNFDAYKHGERAIIPGTCVDTDDGFSPYEQGTFTFATPINAIQTHTDDCLQRGVISYVNEYFCGDQGTVNGIEYPSKAFGFYYNCTAEGKVCSNGACVDPSTISE